MSSFEIPTTSYSELVKRGVIQNRGGGNASVVDMQRPAGPTMREEINPDLVQVEDNGFISQGGGQVIDMAGVTLDDEAWTIQDYLPWLFLAGLIAFILYAVFR